MSFIWLLAFVSAGLWLLLGPSATDSQKQIAEVSAQPAELASFHQATDPHYRNIEQIRVGQRVVTPEASSAEGLPTAVDPLTWKKLTLQAKAHWENGTIDDIEVQTLQPSSWLELHQGVVGASVPIPLDLREMGLPQMNAMVMAIDPCPAIEEGPGRVVLTTVNHLNRFLFDLTVHGKRGPPQAVEVTGWHKLFSEDRQAWTSVCELHLGEVLRGREGELTVASLKRHSGVQRVYNLTVEEEHQYYVSTADLLAHNNGCLVTPASVPVTGSQWYELFAAKYGAENVSWSRVPEYVSGGKTAGVLSTSVGDIDLLSGQIGPAANFSKGMIPGRNGAIMWHVESHAAAAMRDLGLDEATLFINRLPCGPAQGWNMGCQFMLDRMVPVGSRLRVIGPGGYDETFGLPR